MASSSTSADGVPANVDQSDSSTLTPKTSNTPHDGHAATLAPPPAPPTSSAPSAPPALPSADSIDNEEEGDDMLLVTEFPPPPYYYTMATEPGGLKPPEIPYRAFRVAAKKVMAERKRAREESEKIRLLAEGGGEAAAAKNGDKGEGAAKGEKDDKEPGKDGQQKIMTKEEDDDSIDPNDPNEPLVAIFGEIVEDPTLLMEEYNKECDDPAVVRENVKQLNQAVLRGFLKLVRKLVEDPNDNKKLRDELSHNIFLMLQECNKFREHQAREILIETLEHQLARRREGLEMLKKQIKEADDALDNLKKYKEMN